MIIPLRKDYNLELELLDKKIRLIIFHKGIELGCRKENIKELQKFLKLNECLLFKGRLQLHKKGNEILVLFKNETLGSIYFREFETVLNAMIMAEQAH